MKPSESFSIRIFDFDSDYAAVYKLWENAGSGIHLRESDEPAEIKKKLQHDPELFLVAENESQIIGSVLGGFDGRRGFIYHLAVDLACRRVGIGRALMEAIEEQLARKGCIRYYLLVADENNDAHEFYKKFGCELLDVEIYARNLSPRR